MPHSRRNRRPVRLLQSSRHYSWRGAECCADLSDIVPPLCRLPLVLSPLRNPRRAWAMTLGRGTALDRGKTTISSTFGAPPCQMWSTTPSTAVTTPTTSATGHKRARGTVGGFARTTTTPDAILHSTRRQERPTILPRVRGEKR